MVIGIIALVGTDAPFHRIPFAGYAFAAVGHHPLPSMCAAWAGVGGGYGATLLVTPTDAIVYGITETAACAVVPGDTIDIEVVKIAVTRLPICIWSAGSGVSSSNRRRSRNRRTTIMADWVSATLSLRINHRPAMLLSPAAYSE